MRFSPLLDTSQELGLAFFGFWLSFLFSMFCHRLMVIFLVNGEVGLATEFRSTVLK